MRNFFLTTFVFFASLGFVFSQTFSNPPCVISYNDTGLITPFYDSLPCIEKGLPYSSSVQIFMPGTFNSSILLDSLVITSITGLPAGIAYAQNPSTGVYYGDSSGCIAFAGTTSNDSGAYPLTFNGYAVITTQSSGTQTYSLSQLTQIQDAPVPAYYLNVINPGDSCFPKPVATGVSNLLKSVQLSVYPNPSNGHLNLEINAGESINGEVSVYDMTGQKLMQHVLDVAGLYTESINLSMFSKGLYTLQVQTANGSVSKRISIE